MNYKYITGKDLGEIDKNKSIVLTKTILFSLGFSFVFITLGAAASAIGNVLLFFLNELRIVAGLIIIIFSLQMLGFLNFSFLNFCHRLGSLLNLDLLKEFHTLVYKVSRYFQNLFAIHFKLIFLV